MGGTAVTIVDVIRVLPDIHRQEGFEALRNGVAGIGFLRDDKLAVSIGRQPYPTRAEERCALFLELLAECFEGAEITDDGLNYRQLME